MIQAHLNTKTEHFLLAAGTAGEAMNTRIQIWEAQERHEQFGEWKHVLVWELHLISSGSTFSAANYKEIDPGCKGRSSVFAHFQ